MAVAVRDRMPNWLAAAAIALLCVFLYRIRNILLPFVVAAILSFVLAPLVDRLHATTRILPRWVAALTLYASVIAVLGAAAYWWAPVVISEIGRFASDIPETLHRFVAAIAPNGHLVLAGRAIDVNEISTHLLDAVRGRWLSGAGLSLASLGIGAFFEILVGLALLGYFLVCSTDLARRMLWLVPPDHRTEVAQLARQLAPILRRYFLGLLAVVFYTGFASWVGLAALFHIGGAFLLAFVIGLLELIPIIGPIVSILIICLAAMQQIDALVLGELAVFLTALRLSIDQVVGPIVLGKATYLHPVVIIFAFLSGAAFLGALGLILAVPVAAAIKIVLIHYYEEKSPVANAAERRLFRA